MIFKLLYWHWWVLGLVLVVAEGLLPVGVFASMAAGAIVTGAISWINPLSPNALQLAIFATVMAVCYLAIQYIRKRSQNKHPSDQTNPKSYIGREFELTAPVQNGYSEIELDGIIWTLKGPELKPGDLVRVVDTDTDILVIFPLRRKNQTV